MKLFKHFAYAALLWACVGVGNSWAQQLVLAGRDYTVIKTPQPTSSGNKIEVIEFFWYGCIHCYHLEPALKTWLKRKPADVDFKYVPAIFDPASWGPLAKFYYALDAMGLGDKYHDDIFNAIHRDNQRPLVTDSRAMADWLAAKGVDKQKFLEAYNSFGVNSRTQHAIDMTQTYDVPGTPALVIDGKYMTAPSMTLNADKSVNYDRFFRVVDQLVAQARKDHPAAAAAPAKARTDAKKK